MASGSASWMDEVGQTRPRRPSATGPLLPYQLPRNNAGYNNRSHSFSSGQSQTFRPFGFPLSPATTIAEDAIAEGSDGGSDVAHYTSSRRLSNPSASSSHAQDFSAARAFPRNGGLRIDMPPPGTFYQNDVNTPLYTPMSPTGVSEMRRLTAALANGSLATPRTPQIDMPGHSPIWASHSPLTGHRSMSREHNGGDYYGRRDPMSDWQTAHQDATSFALVTFKHHRSDVYYFNRAAIPTLIISSVVVVDADRGQDLGTIVYITSSPIEAHDLKRKLNRDHYERLLQLSQTERPLGWSTENSFNTYHDFNANCAYAGGFQLGDGNSSVKKGIKRLAFDREIQLLDQKRELEERARRLCVLAVQRHGLHLHDMEILDAEFQHDFNKLTFYFLSPQYLHFNPLVTELFKLFKTRIWMSALNPASCIASTAANMSMNMNSNMNMNMSMNTNTNMGTSMNGNRNVYGGMNGNGNGNMDGVLNGNGSDSGSMARQSPWNDQILSMSGRMRGRYDGLGMAAGGMPSLDLQA